MQNDGDGDDDNAYRHDHDHHQHYHHTEEAMIVTAGFVKITVADSPGFLHELLTLRRRRRR